MAAFLHRLALHRAVGAEHAAVAGLGAQQRATGFAFVIPLTSIGGHGFFLAETALRTGHDRLQDHALAPFSYQALEPFTMRTTESITGTSISTPTTVARAAPDSKP